MTRSRSSASSLLMVRPPLRSVGPSRENCRSHVLPCLMDPSGEEAMMSDKDIIENGTGEHNGYVPCRICEQAFRRLRMTARYCARCLQGFCEGEHGSFAYGHGTCVICGAHADYKTRQHPKASETA